MSNSKRAAILLLSIGWMAPLTVAFWIGRAFAWLTFQIATGQGYAVPWHPFELMGDLFYFAMLWLACVMAAWSWWLTKAR